MKRFWDTASVQGAEKGYSILLDGRPMRLPSGTPLVVGKARLADAIAEEWQAAGGIKGGEMSFKDTPLTRLAGTALERIAPDPAPTVDAIARYGETDLLCYRAEAPQNLVERQQRQWQPWLDWVALAYDAPLRVASGVGYVKQHHDSIAALRRAVAALDVDALAGLGIAVPALGSLVLGLALAAGEMDAETAYALGALDELFQAEQWGEDFEAADRRTGMLADIVLAARYIDLTRGNG
ncbi:ATP12 family chaperone protein [Acidisphaera sp. S103]|uniref:ATP12 family chaperone protein n=1 Tax=Acidisphaera sp. S103 TaxID=1747223 RepID=UPI00131EC3CB|nr:ATP12 family protein [Acidisphaera sp. S103]